MSRWATRKKRVREWENKRERGGGQSGRHNFYSKLLLICTCLIVAAWNCFFPHPIHHLLLHTSNAVLYTYDAWLWWCTYKDVRCKWTCKRKSRDELWWVQKLYSYKTHKHSASICRAIKLYTVCVSTLYYQAATYLNLY